VAVLCSFIEAIVYTLLVKIEQAATTVAYLVPLVIEKEGWI